MAKLSLLGKQNALFRLWAREAGQAYERLEQELLNTIDSLRVQGVSDAEIFQTLSSDLENRQGVFQQFKGGLESKQDDLLRQTGQLETFANLETQKLRWALDPTVQEHCNTCLQNSQSGVKTFAEWEALGLPSAGTTDCGVYCMCTLEAE